jgi:signal transduction histidine kinase
MISHNVHSFELEYDEDRVLQVFTNLISNALKFVEPKKGKIIVDFKMGNNELEISVSDNGKGIPTEDHDYIFDKFYQSKHQNTIKPQGSGLGLAITKQIVDKHRGKLWAVRNRKEGACLVFTLPFK